METKEMIEILRYKANNIKAKIEPEFFNEVADRLEECEEIRNKFKEFVLYDSEVIEIKIYEKAIDDFRKAIRKGILSKFTEEQIEEWIEEWIEESRFKAGEIDDNR